MGLPDELIRRAKRCAAAARRILTALVGKGVLRVSDERDMTKQHKRTSPRVSSATGGVMLGIDISNSAALQEMDDLE